MTIEEAITNAIEGGWNAGGFLTRRDRATKTRAEYAPLVLDKMALTDAGISGICDFIQDEGFVEQMLLMSSFWQSLGKALGWRVETYQEEVMIPYTHEIRMITKTKKGHRLVPPWQIHWHHFIDHLAAGKTAETFFIDLT